MSEQKGQPQCKAKSKRSGTQCRNRAVTGFKVCWMHGAGSRIRVERGQRKPSGHPVVTGEHADPERTRYGRLAELLEEAKADPAGLRTADTELALVKAVLRWQYEKLLAGEWDVMKTPEMPEHPGSWLIDAGAKIIDKVARVNGMINRDRIQGMLVLIEPVISVVFSTIQEFLPEDRKPQAREFVRQKLAQVLVPTG